MRFSLKTIDRIREMTALLTCLIVGLLIANLFFSPVVYLIMEGRCTKMFALNCFLWTLGVVPGAIHGFFKLRHKLSDSDDWAD
jgi:uncharacterized membrane protein YqaE (UPF0057 family)